MSIEQRATAEQPVTSVINGRLIHRGGNFIFNDTLFDGYVSITGCTKFRDAQGNPFESINVYHVVSASGTASSYVSTDKGLFLYNSDTGVATCLSYQLTNIVFMRLFCDNTNHNNDVLVGFYPLTQSPGCYGIWKITFNGGFKYDGMDSGAGTEKEIPDDVTWMHCKNGIDDSWSIPTSNGSGYPICYYNNDGTTPSVFIWFLTYNISSKTVSGFRKMKLTNVKSITDVINKNTLLININNDIRYFVISYEKLYEMANVKPLEVAYDVIGSVKTNKKVNDTDVLVSWYDQHFLYRDSINATFALTVKKVDNEKQLLSFAFIVYTNDDNNMIYYVNSDEQDGINGGYVNGTIKHRMYTIIDNSVSGAPRRHIFASSTRLMDINENRKAAYEYYRNNNTAKYSIMPATDKTPIFTINASIEIDPDKYGSVITTDYNSVKGLYYIYTNSHIGIYFMSMRQLTWIASSIMTQINDIWSFSDITVIDGQAKDFVNGIMTTTAMNGPTFDQLFAEIDDLRKRIAALESK